MLAALLVVARSFLWPVRAVAFPDGPIVVLGGGGGERLTRALALRTTGSDGTLQPLVLSAEAVDDLWQRGGSCDDVGVWCVEPVPANTHGEAHAVASLVRAQGWSRVTVVTSDFHVPRTRLVFARCVPVPVRVVAAVTDPPLPERLWRLVRELVATVVGLGEHRWSEPAAADPQPKA